MVGDFVFWFVLFCFVLKSSDTKDKWDRLGSKSARVGFGYEFPSDLYAAAHLQIVCFDSSYSLLSAMLIFLLRQL